LSRFGRPNEEENTGRARFGEQRTALCIDTLIPGFAGTSPRGRRLLEAADMPSTNTYPCAFAFPAAAPAEKSRLRPSAPHSL
jgi:hypothetical protein